ncbi:MAG: efflux RND transporter permease subunit [Desulfobacterales bacterium]
MKLVDTAIKKPVTVSVGVILIVLFGLLALFRIPVQLTPDVDLAQISVSTFWPGASPLEVEQEITDLQEEQLKNLSGLKRMSSISYDSSSSIGMEFELGTDKDDALLRVSNALEKVRRYPTNAFKPSITSGSGSRGGGNSMTYIILRQNDDYKGNDLSQEFNYIDQQIKPYFERIVGVSSAMVMGGREREVQVIIDPEALAARKITIPELMRALDIENRNISAGNIDEGKRRYITRTVGEYTSLEDVRHVIIKRVNNIPVMVSDVARVVIGYQDSRQIVRSNGAMAILMGINRETGSNILLVMDRFKKVLRTVNEEKLNPRGLRFEQSYDQTDYIYSAIGLVRKNILFGGTLAITILLLFLRSFTSTIIVAVAIPISMIGTFFVMFLFGRNINVVSLAGLCFAIGMVVDNSIVVFENIFRHREMGKTRVAAAYDGATEVWGAVLASTLTTVMVFLPIVFVEEEAGQLFRDIAIAISSAVALSLIISITVIPTLSARILSKVKPDDSGKDTLMSVTNLARRFVDMVARYIYWFTGRVSLRLGIIGVLIGIAVFTSWILFPQTDYLPEGNQEMIMGMALPPPGYNLDEFRDIALRVEKDFVPLLTENKESGMAEKLGLPHLARFFFIGYGAQAVTYVVCAVQERTRELIPYIQTSLGKIPGVMPFVMQASLFGRNSGGRSINLEIRGPDLDTLIEIAKQTFGMAMQALPGAQMRPMPSLDLGNPEMRIIPNRDRLSRLGMTTYSLGITVDALVDGTKASNYRLEGEEIDLVVKGEENRIRRIQDLSELPVIAPTGEKVTIGSLAEVRLEEGPTEISHIDGERAITIMIMPPADVALEVAMTTIEEKVVKPMRLSGALPDLYMITYGGTADKLTRTREALMWNFLLAIVISYLLMCALFENFFYPLIIMFSVPLAAAGGFIGIFLVNSFVARQPLDVLTMLGFVILVGIVVNNAILIVHQTLNNMRDGGMAHRDAIVESVRTRIRPIYMSSITTVCGMLPLVLLKGAGSEFYRGIGSVVVGGLLFSTVFTIFLIPALLSLSLDAADLLKRKFSKDPST